MAETPAEMRSYTIDDLMAATDELGRAKIEAAVARLNHRALETENAELRRALAEQINAANSQQLEETAGE